MIPRWTLAYCSSFQFSVKEQNSSFYSAWGHETRACLVWIVQLIMPFSWQKSRVVLTCFNQLRVTPRASTAQTLPYASNFFLNLISNVLSLAVCKFSAFCILLIHFGNINPPFSLKNFLTFILWYYLHSCIFTWIFITFSWFIIN